LQCCRCRHQPSQGFCATIFADKVGHARQMAVAPDGTLYVNSWSGTYYGDDKPPAGGFLLALKDTKGTGSADAQERFGATAAEGDHGGTGIALYRDALYAEINDRIVRYSLKPGETTPTAKPETIVERMPLDGDHPMHPFIIDADGNLFVSMGSATNSCEVKNRMPHSRGNDPCTELKTRAGIWRYDANKTGQRFSPKERYASGLRNAEGSTSTRTVASMSPSTGATSSARTGPSSIPPSRASSCRPRRW
jgi:glucose/arabinose dehydrogenase